MHLVHIFPLYTVHLVQIVHLVNIVHSTPVSIIHKWHGDDSALNILCYLSRQNPEPATGDWRLLPPVRAFLFERLVRCKSSPWSQKRMQTQVWGFLQIRGFGGNGRLLSQKQLFRLAVWYFVCDVFNCEKKGIFHCIGCYGYNRKIKLLPTKITQLWLTNTVHVTVVIMSAKMRGNLWY